MLACVHMQNHLSLYSILIYIYIHTLAAPGFRKGWGGVGWGMLTSCSCYVVATLMGGVGWGGVGWGMLASCSCYVAALNKNQGTAYVKLAARQQGLGSSPVETLKKKMLQQGDEVEATTSKKGLTINMCRFMLTLKFTANTIKKDTSSYYATSCSKTWQFRIK